MTNLTNLHPDKSKPVPYDRPCPRFLYSRAFTSAFCSQDLFPTLVTSVAVDFSSPFAGIPISQQHLIWQSLELEDDYCLHDYSIHNGATLKLVLAMRGGPINTRRSEYTCTLMYTFTLNE